MTDVQPTPFPVQDFAAWDVKDCNHAGQTDELRSANKSDKSRWPCPLPARRFGRIASMTWRRA